MALKFQVVQTGIAVMTGGAIMLGTLMAWTGETDLTVMKNAVKTYVNNAETHVSQFASDYKVTVENANAEIGDYQEALAEANANIDKLVTEYSKQKEELKQAQKDMGNMITMQEAQQLIERANEEITKANQQVASAKTEIVSKTSGDLEKLYDETVGDIELNVSKEGEEPKASEIPSDLLPTEQPTEQPQEQPQEQ